MSVQGYERAIFYLSATVDITNAKLPPRVDPSDVPGDGLFSVGWIFLLRPWKGWLCYNWSACVQWAELEIVVGYSEKTTLNADKMRHSWPDGVCSFCDKPSPVFGPSSTAQNAYLTYFTTSVLVGVLDLMRASHKHGFKLRYVFI